MSEDIKKPQTSEEDEVTVEVVTFEDDEGNPFDMEIIEEFEYEGKKYAVLADFSEEEEQHTHAPDEECECEQSLYIFEVVAGENEQEDFVSIEDDKLLDELSTVVEDL